MSGHHPFSIWVVADEHPIAGQLAQVRNGAVRIGVASVEAALVMGMPASNDGEVRGVFARVSRAAADSVGVPTYHAVGQRRRCTPKAVAARRAVVFVLREAGWSWRTIARQIGCDRTTAMGCYKAAAKALAQPLAGFHDVVATAKRALKPFDGVATN